MTNQKPGSARDSKSMRRLNLYLYLLFSAFTFSYYSLEKIIAKNQHYSKEYILGYVGGEVLTSLLVPIAVSLVITLIFKQTIKYSYGVVWAVFFIIVLFTSYSSQDNTLMINSQAPVLIRQQHT